MQKADKTELTGGQFLRLLNMNIDNILWRI